MKTHMEEAEIQIQEVEEAPSQVEIVEKADPTTIPMSKGIFLKLPLSFSDSIKDMLTHLSGLGPSRPSLSVNLHVNLHVNTINETLDSIITFIPEIHLD